MNDDSPPTTYVGYAMTGYFLTLMGAFFVYIHYTPQGFLLALTFAAPAAFLLFATQQGRKARKYAGPMSATMKVYRNRILVLMLFYGVFLFFAVWANDAYKMPVIMAWMLAILPSLPVIGVIWAVARLIVEETDEYIRTVHVRGVLIATGFMLSIVTVYGFLEQFELVPHFVAYWAVVLWFGGLGFAKIFEAPRA